MPKITSHEGVTKVVEEVRKTLVAGHEVLVAIEADESLSEPDLAYLCGQYLTLGTIIGRLAEATENLGPDGRFASLGK